MSQAATAGSDTFGEWLVLKHLEDAVLKRGAALETNVGVSSKLEGL
jgi:hypothetical protein